MIIKFYTCEYSNIQPTAHNKNAAPLLFDTTLRFALLVYKLGSHINATPSKRVATAVAMTAAFGISCFLIPMNFNPCTNTIDVGAATTYKTICVEGGVESSNNWLFLINKAAKYHNVVPYPADFKKTIMVAQNAWRINL